MLEYHGNSDDISRPLLAQFVLVTPTPERRHHYCVRCIKCWKFLRLISGKPSSDRQADWASHRACLDKFIEDKDQKARLAHDLATMADQHAQELAKAQLEVNKVEAAHKSLFVSLAGDPQ